jgi:hypothetical protein
MHFNVHSDEEPHVGWSHYKDGGQSHLKWDFRMNLQWKKLVGGPYSGWEDNVEKDTVSLLHIWNWKLVAQNRIGGRKLRRSWSEYRPKRHRRGRETERERENLHSSSFVLSIQTLMLTYIYSFLVLLLHVSCCLVDVQLLHVCFPTGEKSKSAYAL